MDRNDHRSTSAPVDGETIEIYDGDEPAPPGVLAWPPGADELVAGARGLFDLGDFSGSLRLAEQALILDPVHAEARDYLGRSRDTLIQMYESKLGCLSRTPRVLLHPNELVWLDLDHRAGFVLAQIDGQVTIEDLFALSGMGKLDTAKILVELFEQGAITC